MNKILDEIRAEREYQVGKWGIYNDDETNTPWMWTSYIAQYATSWMRGTFNVNADMTENFRNAMVKVATLAVAAIQSIDRQRTEKGKPFYETE